MGARRRGRPGVAGSRSPALSLLPALPCVLPALFPDPVSIVTGTSRRDGRTLAHAPDISRPGPGNAPGPTGADSDVPTDAIRTAIGPPSREAEGRWPVPAGAM